MFIRQQFITEEKCLVTFETCMSHDFHEENFQE